VRGTVPKMAAHREVVGVPFALLYQIKGFICYYSIPLNFTIFTSIQHPTHSMYKTMTDSVLKWLKTSHRGSSFHELPIGAARGFRKANCL